MNLKKRLLVCIISFVSVCFIAASNKDADVPRRLEILFLGHKSKHHNSTMLADILQKEYFKDGINITYTTDPNDMNEANLKNFDGLVLYANHDEITKDQEKALLSFVRGKRVYSASLCLLLLP